MSNFSCSHSSNFKCSCSSNFNCLYCCKLQVSLFVDFTCSHSSNFKCSCSSNFNCSCCCELQVFLLLWTSAVFIAASFRWSYYVKLNFLFTSLYPVSRVYTTLSTLDSALLRNTEIPLLIFILWLCLPNIPKESSSYFLIFCINLFTMFTINCLAGIVRRNELFASTVSCLLSCITFMEELFTSTVDDLQIL